MENISEMGVFYMVYQDSTLEAEYVYISTFVYACEHLVRAVRPRLT